MIIQEIFEGNPELIRTYSDRGYRIRQVDTGIVYDEAVDAYNTTHYYEETTEKIDTGEPEEAHDPYEDPDYSEYEGYLKPQEAIDIIFGG